MNNELQEIKDLLGHYNIPQFANGVQLTLVDCISLVCGWWHLIELELAGIQVPQLSNKKQAEVAKKVMTCTFGQE